jgi:hypothetical protein
MKRRYDTFRGNFEEYGNLKRSFTSILTSMKNEEYDKDIIDVLMRVRNRLNVCSHCGGETDDAGTCYSTL